MPLAAPVVEGLQRLAVLTYDRPEDNDRFIDEILRLLAESLDVGLTHLSRVDGTTQHIERVHNRAGLRLEAGDAVQLGDSYCQNLLVGSRRSLVVENVAADPQFADLPATTEIGIGAYTGVPLYRSEGQLYGTLCTLHPTTRAVDPGEVELMALAGRVIMHAVEVAEQHAAERREAREALEGSLAREREARSRAEDALRLRTEFLSLASHELKTPLTILRLQLESIRRQVEDGMENVSSRVTQTFDRVDRQLQRMARLSNDLVEASRLSFGTLQLVREPVDLNALVAETVERLDEDVKRYRSEVRFHAPVPIEGQWDHARIEQLVGSLLSNALKYGSGQPIDIDLARESAHAVLTVRDRGMGIAPEDQTRIFGRYERVESKENVAGLGLGLYIAYEVVKAHGGTISVASCPGEGSTFTVRLPLEE